MRITHISDTPNKHNQLNGKLPGGQLLIHSGDISSLGREYEVESFIKWFGKQDYTHKVFVAGNHDMSFDREILLRDKLAHFEGRDRNDYNTSCSEGKPQWLEKMLNNLPDKYLFSPWEAPKNILKEAGVVLGENYPYPIVNLQESRNLALEAYDKIKLKNN